MADIELNDDEIAVLKLGLKHGLLIRPKENEMIAVMEYIYDQIVCQDLLKKDNISKHRVQTALKSFTYFYLDIDLKHYSVGSSIFRIFQNDSKKDTVSSSKFVKFTKAESFKRQIWAGPYYI